MPWTKSGDTAATYPRLLAVDELPTADDYSVNEVAGFILRLFFHSAGHMTDYVVRFGDVKAMGGGRHELLVSQAVAAGLLEPVSGEGRGRVWKLVEDPEFIHVRRRAEVQFDRQRDKDRRNPDLTMPVRLRDGDGCRYCGNTVNWADRKSGRAGTYDHRNPGQAATVESYVVSCKSCNSKRQDDPDADEHTPLLPPPPVPLYSKKTREILEAYYGPEHVAARLGEAVPDTAPPTGDVRPGTTPQAAPAAPARPQAVRPASVAPETPQSPPAWRLGPDPDHREITGPDWIQGVDAGSGRVGSGLAGPGREGPGLVGPGLAGSPPRSESRSRARRRGRRNRKQPPEEGT